MAYKKDIRGKIVPAIAAAIADYTTAAEISAVDLLGFNAVAFFIDVGTITVAGSGKVTPKMQESDNGTDWTDVAAGDLVGSFSDLETDTNQVVGYNGIKRYVKLVFTNTATVSAANYGVIVVKGSPSIEPTQEFATVD